ncbi:MAG: hypothetical protein NVS9B15_20450 [Acidobacteriaceae bacterium]
MQHLLENNKPTQAEMDGALTQAAVKGNVPLAAVLLAHGARVFNELTANTYPPPSSPFAIRSTALASAVESRNPEMVRLILGQHPDVNAHARNQSGETALMMAAGPFAPPKEGQEEMDPADTENVAIAHMLLSAGARVDERDDFGRTALFSADQRPAMAKTLVAAGANVNARNKEGLTPLMTYMDEASVKALLDAGADLMLQDTKGKTALDHARERNSTKIAAMLEKADTERAAGKRR